MSSKSPAKSDNGTPPPEAKARALKFITQGDPDPPERAEVSRDPHDGEPWAPYVVKEGKTVQLVAHDASLTPKKQLEVAQQLLKWAESQHEQSIAGVSAKRILAADRLWRKRNPRIELPDAATTSRDVAGRWVKGGGRAVALITERIAAEPTSARAMTAAEREIVRVLAPELYAAVERFEQVAAAALAEVEQAAMSVQTVFPGGVPSIPVDRRETEEASA